MQFSENKPLKDCSREVYYVNFESFDVSQRLNLVIMAFRVTPLPIPNRSVKPLRANGTAGEALWESRSLPD